MPLITLGCAVVRLTPTDMTVWELATAHPVDTVHLGRVRVSVDRPIPAPLIRKLSAEFSLVIINQQSDLDTLREQLDLPEGSTDIELSRGIIIGLLAEVGETAMSNWPIQLKTVRVSAGQGWLEVTFLPGIYYPLKTAGYLELAYVPGLQTVQMVCINHRKFLIHPDKTLHHLERYAEPGATALEAVVLP